MKHPCLFQLACLVAVQIVVKATISIVDSSDRTIDYLDDTEATIIDRVLQGYIESSNPSDACTNISPPTYPSNYTMQKLVLINGTSECDLITKMQNVAAVGYEVAIVYNPSPEPFHYNITFPITTSHVNVSVVIILYEDGILIKNNYLFHKVSDKDTMTIKIFPAKSWGLLITELIVKLLLSVFFVVCLATILALLRLACEAIKEKIQNCLRRNSGEHVRGRGDVNDHADDREDVNEHAGGREVFHGQSSSSEFERAYEEGLYKRLQRSLNIRCPTVQYSEGDRYDMCVVCFTPFKEREEIRVLKKCGHAFHSITCIDEWLLKYSTTKRNCPVCNGKIFLVSSLDHSESGATENTPLLSHSLARPQGSVNHGLWFEPDEGNDV